MPTWRSAKPVRPASLFRIASMSKPFTATAVLQLVEQGKLKLDERVFPILKLEPHLERGARFDPRWHEITVRHCLQHTGGWDRDKSFDPMGAETAEQVAKALKVRLPIHPRQIIRYTMGKPLDFAPGTAYAYSNFGYCVLGRVIEAVTRKPYHEFVSEKILAPLGIRDMRLGKNLLKDRAPGEVKYYDSKRRTGRAISGPEIGKQAPLPYGVECIETMDANGGWIASAVDLLRFATALDDPKKCPVLKEESILVDARAAAGTGGPRTGGQAQGGLLRLRLGGAAGRAATGQVHQVAHGWAGGKLHAAGLPRRRHQLGRAVQQRRRPRTARSSPALIDPLLHKPADEIKNWPDIDLFSRF